MNKFNEQMQLFADILGKMSPENLYCDGEVSHSDAMRKKAVLKKQWNLIEKEIRNFHDK